MELALGPEQAGMGVAYEWMFQSLFLWNSLSDAHGGSARHNWTCVSILVFVELALGLTTLGACDGFQGHVSILVFVELALGHRGPAHGACPMEVSILVFVELALGRRSAFLSGTLGRYCFNPCFCGTRSRTAAFFRPFSCFSVSNRPFLTLLKA